MAMMTGSGRVERKVEGKSERRADPFVDWDAWVALMATRQPFAPSDLLPAARSHSPLLWPLSAEFPESNAAELISFLVTWKPTTSQTKSLARRLELWSERVEQQELEPPFALECLAWSHILPRLATVLPRGPWCQLLESLLAVVERAKSLDLLADPLLYLLLRGELPWVLSGVLPELASTAALGEPASRLLSESILELLDGEGLPSSRFWNQFRGWFACWTRSALWARSLGLSCFHDEAQAQYAWLVRESIRFSRQDGTLMLSDAAVDSNLWDLLAAALELTTSELDRRIAQTVWPRRTEFSAPGSEKQAKKSGRNHSASGSLPPSAVHSEWATAALLRRGWAGTEPSLAVTWGRRELDLELHVHGQTVLSGCWDCQIELDGRRLQPTDDYAEVCWVCDEDVDYLELEVPLADGWRMQRQLLLTQDRFLFLADALLGNRIADVRYCGTLPLRAEIGFVPEQETCEGMLSGRRPLALVLPLDLPEWRMPPRGQRLEQTSAGLQLQRQSRTTRLMNALFLDLEPSRFRQPRTWRQLTVAQRLERQTDDVAVGYRVQIGLQQWLFYRSLAAKANRTVLGQNFNSDFVAARFLPNGTTQKLLEVE